MTLFKSLITFTAAMFFAGGVMAEDTSKIPDVYGGIELGLGNKSWSYIEGTVVAPLVDNDSYSLSLGINLMDHIEGENTESVEKSLSLIYRQPFTDREGFWGINASYSDYITWDGNDRQTPHLGFEYVLPQYSIIGNYMFQDKTEHWAETPYKMHSYYGDKHLAVAEMFTGGWELLANYHPTDRWKVGLGVHDRFGDDDKYFTLTDADGNVTQHKAEKLHLLKRGIFVETSYQAEKYKLSAQLKHDEHNGFLSMFRITYDLGNTRGTGSHVDRAYRAPVYKADPDDFGVILTTAAITDLLVVGGVFGAAAVGSISTLAITSCGLHLFDCIFQ